MNILDCTQKKSGKFVILLLVLVCVPANLLIACNDVSKIDKPTESRLEVETNNVVTTPNEETVKNDVENMLPILQSIAGLLLENDTYDYANDTTYWKALDFAVNEYIRAYDPSSKIEGNFYIVSPETIEDLANVLFPERANFKKVSIPNFNNVKYARYDETQNVYYMNIGELGGGFQTNIENITINADGSVTVSVVAGASFKDENHSKTYTFSLTKNKKASNSHFVYSIKNAERVN